MSGPSSAREARIHTQPSNRANASLGKGKSKAEDDRRVVYKSVLENPYQIKWPQTPLNVQNSLLACLADLLPEVASYHIARETKARKRKSSLRAALHQTKRKEVSSEASQAQTPNSRKRRQDEDNPDNPKRTKVDHDETNNKKTSTSSSSLQSPGINVLSKLTYSSNSHDAGPSATAADSKADESTSHTAPTIPLPPLLNHCVFGINEVTRRLESQIHPDVLGAEIASNATSKPKLRFVVVCRTDVDPPILIEHLPVLVASCNSAIPSSSEDSMFIKLVTLPMGGEHTLAEVVGLRRVAVMALDAETPGLERLESLLSSITPLRASWLAPPSNISQEPKELIPTHVKQLKTSAPKDMKAHREKRKREVGEAKEASKTASIDGSRRKRRRLQPESRNDPKLISALELLQMLSDDDSDISGGDDLHQLTVNEHYAKAFEYRKEREELAKLKEKYGSDFEEDESDSESDETEDEYGEELTPAVDAALLRTLAKIRRKDPEIYDSKVGVFDEEAKRTQGTNLARTRPSKDKSKPLTIKQQNLAALLESGSRPTSPTSDPAPLTHAQEQAALRDETISAFHNAVKEDEADDLLTLREGVKDEAEQREEEYRDFLQREVGEDISQLLWVEEGGVKIKEDDTNLAEDDQAKKEERKKKRAKRKEHKQETDEEFLMNYILNRGWIDKSENRAPTYKEIVGVESKAKAKDGFKPGDAREDEGEDLGNDLLDEDEFDEVADHFESTYNFRFEEPNSHIIASHPRNVASVRRTDSSRKEAREKKKEREAAKLLAKKEEVKRLKSLKMREFKQKLEKIRIEGGLENKDKGKRKLDEEEEGLEDYGVLGELDLDGDWDPDQHDAQMKSLYAENGEYEDDNQKPTWDDDIDISDLVPEKSEPVSESQAGKKKKRKKRKDGEEEDIGVDLDEMDADIERPVQEGDDEEWDGTEDMRKRVLEKYMEEMYDLDFNDMVGDMPTRFHYSHVEPSAYGLTPVEILTATDAELNSYVGLKRLAPYHKDKFDHRRGEKLKELKNSLSTRGVYDGWGAQGETQAKKRKGKKERQKEKAKAAMDATIKQEEQVQEEEGPKNKKRKRKHKKGGEAETAQ
ncbi:KRI1-like family, partial [Rhizoctonia solani]